jgi:hypothetical protein
MKFLKKDRPSDSPNDSVRATSNREAENNESTPSSDERVIKKPREIRRNSWISKEIKLPCNTQSKIYRDSDAFCVRAYVHACVRACVRADTQLIERSYHGPRTEGPESIREKASLPRRGALREKDPRVRAFGVDALARASRRQRALPISGAGLATPSPTYDPESPTTPDNSRRAGWSPRRFLRTCRTMRLFLAACELSAGSRTVAFILFIYVLRSTCTYTQTAITARTNERTHAPRSVTTAVGAGRCLQSNCGGSSTVAPPRDTTIAAAAAAATAGRHAS